MSCGNTLERRVEPRESHVCGCVWPEHRVRRTHSPVHEVRGTEQVPYGANIVVSVALGLSDERARAQCIRRDQLGRGLLLVGYDMGQYLPPTSKGIIGVVIDCEGHVDQATGCGTDTLDHLRAGV